MKIKNLSMMIAVVLIATLGGCAEDAEQITPTTNSNIVCERLFTIDSIKVYRFMDAGHYIYFTDARGTTMWIEKRIISNGKITTILYEPKSVENVR